MRKEFHGGQLKVLLTCKEKYMDMEKVLWLVAQVILIVVNPSENQRNQKS